MRRAWSVLLTALVCLSLAAPALAHGGGTLMGVWERGSLRVAVQTDETPHAGWLGGTIHVTVIAMSQAASDVRVRDLDVNVRGFHTGSEEQAGPIGATRTLNGAYEADLSVRTPGTWRVEVALAQQGVEDTIEFDVEVARRSSLGDLFVVGGLMAVPVIGLAGLARRQRPGRRS